MSILNKIFSWNKQPRTPYYGFNYGGGVPPERNVDGFLRAYGEIGWLFAVVSKIGVGCSGVKWRLFTGDERSERSGVGKHPVLTTLDKFNPFQTGAEGIELTQIYLDLIGECFWILNYNALDEPAEIWIPYPSKMSIVPDKQEFIKGYVYGSGQESVPFELNEIIHFKYPNPLNQYRGMSPAQALAVDLDAEQYSGEWNRNFFYNSARPDGVIEFDYKLSDEQFDRLKKQWSEKHKGVSKAHQVGLLEGGGKYKQIQVSQKDMDFRALRLMNRDNILGVYGMPLSVMGITENVNKANAEAGDYTFARWLVKPRLDRMKNKLNEQFIPLFRKSENLELDYDEVVPETLEQKMQLAESGIRAGYLTINEARKLRGLDPLKPDMGDVLLVPLNLIPTPISGKPIPAPAPARAPAREEEKPIEESFKGGEGSGNFDHEGRPGEVGGSGGGGGGGSKPSGNKPGGGNDGENHGHREIWKPTMSSADAEKWSADSSYKETIYHGTNKAGAIEDGGFGHQFIGGTTGNAGMLGEGFYFSPDIESANQYGNKTLKVKVNVKNVCPPSEFTKVAKEINYNKLYSQDSMKAPIAMRKALQAKGYDAVQFKWSIKEVCVFNSRDIVVIKD